MRRSSCSASAPAFRNDEIVEDGDGESVPFGVVKDAERLGPDWTTALVEAEGLHPNKEHHATSDEAIVSMVKCKIKGIERGL